MRNYWIKEGDFGNVYDLCHTDGLDLRPMGYSQITRREAVALARRESVRRGEDPSFSGYAPEYIQPYGLSEAEEEEAYLAWCNRADGGSNMFRVSGRVVEWRKFRVLPEHRDAWTDKPGECIVDYREIRRLAREWGTTIKALLAQVEEI